jgi:hypothetical protein
MEPEGSLAYKMWDTGPSPEPDESSPHPPTLFKIHSNIIVLSQSRPSK